MWGKRKEVKAGDKKLRCKVQVTYNKGFIACDRPAKRYACEKRGYDLGVIECCINHARLHEKQGISMNVIDRRTGRVADRKVA